MAAFQFSPELIEVRADVIARLDEEGFQWLSHYGSVDPDHEDYGIEVCGIQRREDAVSILGVLESMFPDWRNSRYWHKDYGAEPGWKVQITRDRRSRGRDWMPIPGF